MGLFNERLKDLMEENKVSAKILADSLGMADSSIIYYWLKSEKGLLINSAIKLADYFHCTIEYLIGREMVYKENKPLPCLPFGHQLKKALAAKKVTQYRLLKDTNLSRGNLNNWFNNKSTPHIDSVIKIADYLKITIDELVGRE